MNNLRLSSGHNWQDYQDLGQEGELGHENVVLSLLFKRIRVAQLNFAIILLPSAQDSHNLTEWERANSLRCLRACKETGQYHRQIHMRYRDLTYPPTTTSINGGLSIASQPSASIPQAAIVLNLRAECQILGELAQLIILRYTNLENLKNMTTQVNIFADHPNQWSSDLNGYLNNLTYEDDPIEKFLNQEVFFDRNQGNEIDTANELTNSHLLEPPSVILEERETQGERRRKSIFHNFQKHLITLIKKFIVLPIDDSDRLRFSDLALVLWAAFMKTRSFNKKILHMVFGLQESIKESGEFFKLAEEYPQFKRIIGRTTYEEIMGAQAKIREEFVSQAMRLDKRSLQSTCNVNRLQEFYQYYISFISELRSGPMSKRMTKSRKCGVLERLSGAQKCQ